MAGASLGVLEACVIRRRAEANAVVCARWRAHDRTLLLASCTSLLGMLILSNLTVHQSPLRLVMANQKHRCPDGTSVLATALLPRSISHHKTLAQVKATGNDASQTHNEHTTMRHRATLRATLPTTGNPAHPPTAHAPRCPSSRVSGRSMGQQNDNLV